MNMLPVMVVVVVMLDARGMNMNMLMRPVPVGLSKPPHKIRQSETCKQPRRDTAPHRFEKFELPNRYPHATPISPITTELPTCPIPQRKVITIVLKPDHFLAQESITKGR